MIARGSRHRDRRAPRRRVLLAAIAAGAAICPTAVAKPLTLVGRQRLDLRLEQLTFRTPAIIGNTTVRVLLPAGYGTHPRRRYPVLYLLHGATDDYTSWTLKGDAERLTARYPLLVVMPDSGSSGGYTNWHNDGRGGPPEWETYHIEQLIPWIDEHFRTRPSRAGRAIAGLSTGGFGAMSYAARHPDLFAAAASFSGALDTNSVLDIAVTGAAVFGPRATEEVRWRGHNPWDLAENLRGVKLTIRAGNGMPGGPYGPAAGRDIIEFAVHQMSVSFHKRLSHLGIPSVWDDYGPGGHLWPYWQRDLSQTLPTLMAVFAHPSPAPSSFDFTAVESRYCVYGWTVAVRRSALEFSTLRVNQGGRFSLTGSGAATVTTAATFRPGAALMVVVRDATGRHSRRLVVSRLGRLSVGLSLGQSNRYQQYTPLGAAAPRRSVTARVRVEGPA